MRCTQWSVAISAVLSLATARAQAQAALDVQRPKPVVMLLVDSSGSMERMPGFGTTTTSEFPECSPQRSDKNRWAVTLEALTGTFQSYQCHTEQRSEPKYRSQYDYNYHIPHYNFTTSSENFSVVATQDANGIIDSFSQRVKFGLMTFDGIGTTLNGDTLVPLSDFNQPGFSGKVSGAPGMYSYGRVGELSFPNCEAVYGINAGARRDSKEGDDAHAGALIPVGEDGADIADANQKVQQSLLAVRPFGGTPTAAMLDDLRYYLMNDESVKSGSDKYYDCRDRYAVFITDGAPDKLFRDSRFQCQSTEDAKCAGGKCSCPYDTETAIAADLHASDKKLLKKLIVIALDVDEEAKALLDGIAQSGGSEMAIAASSPSQLTRELDKLLVSISSDAATRSTPQIVHNGLPPHAGGKQYEITAGFRLPGWEELPWDGLLYRRRFECSGTVPVEAELDESRGDFFHTRLNEQARTGRSIVTFVGKVNPETTKNGSLRSPDYADGSPARSTSLETYNTVAPSGTPFAKGTPDASANALQAITPVELEEKNFTTTLSAKLFGDGSETSENQAVRQRIVTYVHASDASKRPQAMADIYHSNPVVLAPLTRDSNALNTSDAQLNTTLRTLLSTEGETAHYGSDGRPGVVFVGTNDGVLHAFNLDDWKDKSGTTIAAGHEFWGFVPPALFGKLGTASLPTHQEMFDGTPLVRNVMLYRGEAGNTHAGRFATVLLSAVRGAPAYVALDVTHPERPPVPLWQFSAPGMGLTVATPALTQARVFWDDAVTARERAIAILPGGTGLARGSADCKEPVVKGRTRAPFPAAGVREHVRCWQQRGRGLYVVDVATGQLIQEFDYQHFPSPLTGSVAVDGDGLDVSSAAYFTDHDGVLWRLSMVDPDPSKWKVEPVWDLFHTDKNSSIAYKKGRPSIYAPLLSRDVQGNYVILVGTGDVDNLVEATKIDAIQHRVVSLLEERQLQSTGGATALSSESSITANWEQVLVTGESVTGPLSLFDQVTYFGTFVSPQTDNACDFGNSRIWALDYMQADTSNNPLPRWPDGVGEDNKPKYVEYVEQELEDALVLGVSIATTPLCVSKTETDPFSPMARVAADAQIGGGGYQIRALLSGRRNATSGASEVTGFQKSLMTSSNARSVGWGGAVE